MQKNLFTQNAKMRKSSDGQFTLVNWTIPAFMSSTGLKTCPNAGLCAVGCYARSGNYMFGNVRSAHEAKLALTLTDDFVPQAIASLEAWLSKRSVDQLKVRIHDAGDFYSKEYALKWFKIMNHFQHDERISFYAYTKQVRMFKGLLAPKNFTLIYSFGGRQDVSIDIETDRHSRVFETLEDLQAHGYVDGTSDDMVAAVGTSGKIGLVYHGAKSYKNTKWALTGSQQKEI